MRMVGCGWKYTNEELCVVGVGEGFYEDNSAASGSMAVCCPHGTPYVGTDGEDRDDILSRVVEVEQCCHSFVLQLGLRSGVC